MKSFIVISITFLALSLSAPSFSYDRWNCSDSDSGCGNSYCTRCQCTDPGVGRNDCISDSKYCEAFGNVGRNSDMDL